MISEDKRKVLDLFAQGRKLYKLMQFQEAKKYFGEALKIDSKDGPSIVYWQRCDHYTQNPPPEDWDGVFVFKTK
ncbi:MAG TPA: tetratricopeptide repeat protein [Rectinemataceae bacterium]|nr:tetratricopeptide repeat protein [Rectinemataceae bacterium]